MKTEYKCGDLIKFWAWTTKKGKSDWNGCCGQVIPLDKRMAGSRIGVIIGRLDQNQYEIFSSGIVVEVHDGYLERIL
jgi:hypothetical protein